MAFITTVPDGSAQAPAEIYDEERESWGFVPNFATTFALRPEVYLAWKQLVTAIRSSMDARRYELATVGAAAALRSSYCTLAHGRALAGLMPPEGVVQLMTDREAAPVDDAERAVIAFAEQVALDADHIEQADIDGLRAHGLADEEIFDVVLTAAARCFFSKTLDATGTAPDAAFHDLEPKLRAVLTVGRPIAEAQ